MRLEKKNRLKKNRMEGKEIKIWEGVLPDCIAERHCGAVDVVLDLFWRSLGLKYLQP